jgi:hypothetical protein
MLVAVYGCYEQRQFGGSIRLCIVRLLLAPILVYMWYILTMVRRIFSGNFSIAVKGYKSNTKWETYLSKIKIEK